jgi:predicted ATPase
VIYDSILTRQRKQIHEEVGKAIENLYTERLEEFYEILAYHYQRSDNGEKAVEYLTLAAKKEAYKFASGEAMIFSEEALKILDNLAVTEETQKIRRNVEFFQLELKAISSEIVPV